MCSDLRWCSNASYKNLPIKSHQKLDFFRICLSGTIHVSSKNISYEVVIIENQRKQFPSHQSPGKRFLFKNAISSSERMVDCIYHIFVVLKLRLLKDKKEVEEYQELVDGNFRMNQTISQFEFTMI